MKHRFTFDLHLLPRLISFFILLGVPISLRSAPNIVLILTDDQGWSQLSETMDSRWPEARSGYLETPNLERMIRGGMRFTSGYSPAPLCTPTRRSILCGTSAARSGTEFPSDWVPAEHLTIPKALKTAHSEYRCAHFGKWGERMISHPTECGYDASSGETGNETGGMPSSLIGKGKNHADGPPHFVDNDDPKKTDSVTDKSIAFIRQQHARGRPFYLQASYYAVHLSIVARQKTIDKYLEKGTPDRGYSEAWAAMLEELDQGIGRILDTLEELEIEEETYVIFTTDNGGRGTLPGGDEERPAPNTPLTGAKHSLDEGGIRVPFIVTGPGIEAGSECHTPVVGYDLLPTFYDLAGGAPGKAGIIPPTVDGVSFAPLLKDPEVSLERPNGGAIYFHRPRRQSSAIRKGDHKLKVTWSKNDRIIRRALFKVNPDPREEGYDIATENPELVADLEKTLLDHLDAVEAKKPSDFAVGKKGSALRGKTQNEVR